MDIHRLKRSSSLPLHVVDEHDRDTESSSNESNLKLNTTQDVQELLQFVQSFSFQESQLNDEHPKQQEEDDDRPGSKSPRACAQQEVANQNHGIASHDTENCLETMDRANVALELLEKAQKERDEARRWSNDIRQAVRAWVIEQRKLMEQPMRALREELRISTLERLESEAKMRKLILVQQDRIDALEATIASQKEPKMSVSTVAVANSSCQSSRNMTVASRTSTISTGTQTITATEEMKTPPRTRADAKFRRHETPATVSPPSPPARKQSSRRTTHSSTTPRADIRQVYPNGAVREVFPDREVVHFTNGDRQTTTRDGVVAYTYGATGVTQVETGEKLRLEFANGQVEEHWKNGRVVVTFPDGRKQEFVRTTDDGGSPLDESTVSFAVTI